MKVPLLNKAINYIENPNDAKVKSAFTQELASSNSSITLIFVVSRLAKLSEKYEGNETYRLVMNVLNEQLKTEAPDFIMSYDEEKRRFVKKPLNKSNK